MTARRRLPNRRPSWSFGLECGGLDYVCTHSHFSNGDLAEIFLSNHKSGSQADANSRDAAILASICLQFGAPLDVVRKSLLRDSQDRPSTPVGVALDALAAIEAEGKKS